VWPVVKGECKTSMKAYLKCLSDNKSDHHGCRELSQSYLQCRMDRDLMRKEDMNELGFGDRGEYVRVNPDPDSSKEKKGFIAGLGVNTRWSK
jgi:cytochrome c oxidase assembly protein subunit 19